MNNSEMDRPTTPPSDRRRRERQLESFHVEFILSGVVVYEDDADWRGQILAALEDQVADYLDQTDDAELHWGPWEEADSGRP